MSRGAEYTVKIILNIRNLIGSDNPVLTICVICFQDYSVVKLLVSVGDSNLNSLSTNYAVLEN